MVELIIGKTSFSSVLLKQKSYKNDILYHTALRYFASTVNKKWLGIENAKSFFSKTKAH